jgi:hypothetical protein
MIPTKHISTTFIETRLVYDSVCNLWEMNNWPSIPLGSLPPMAIITSEQDTGDVLAAAFVYHTNSNLGWFEWLVCHKECRREYRSEVLNSTIRFAEDYAKTNGMVLFSSVKSVNLISRLESRKWKKTDGGMTNFIFGG